MTRTITLDISDSEALAAAVRQLDSDVQDLLLNAVREVKDEDNKALILRTVREVLARDLPGCQVAGVLFSACESYNENFNYFDVTAQVVRVDGSITDVDFDQLGGTLEEAWDDVVELNSTILVNLRRGTVIFGDGSRDLRESLEVPAPAWEATNTPR